MRKRKRNDPSLFSLIVTPLVSQSIILSLIILIFSTVMSFLFISRFFNTYEKERAFRLDTVLRNTLDIPFLINRQNQDLVLHGDLDKYSTDQYRNFLINQYKSTETLTLVGLGLENGFYNDIKYYMPGSLYWSNRSPQSGRSINWEMDERGHLLDIVFESADYDHRERPWYTSAAESGAPVWSPVYVTTNPERLLISASTPIIDEDNTLLGVAVSSLSLSEIKDQLSRIPSFEGSDLYLLEKSGNIIAGTGTEAPFILEGETPRRRHISESNDPTLSYIYKESFLEKHIPEEGVFVRGLYLRIINYHYFNDSRGIDWVVIVSTDASPLFRGTVFAVLLISLILVLILFLSLFINRRTAAAIANPILSLRDAAARIDKGDLSPRLEVKGALEIKQLSRSFNGMADRLSQLVTNLEDRVRERTEQLEESNRKLEQSQKMMKLHIQNTPLSVINWSKDLHILGWNPSAEKLFGYSADEVINKHNATLLVADDMKELITQIEKELIITKKGLQISMENLTKKGDHLFCDWYNTPLIDEDGEFIGISSLVMDITERVELRRKQEDNQLKLREISHTDGLTGIANRRLFDDYLSREWKRAERSKSSLSLIISDIDFFKKYNDMYGHLEGDSCLREVAQVLEGVMKRPADKAARYGGEEFACILPETDLAGAVSLAEEIIEDLKERHIPHGDSSVSPFVTLSLGIASLKPDGNISEEELIRLADRKLYLAKNEGRNCFRA